MMRLLIVLTTAIALAACSGAAPTAQAPATTIAGATLVAATRSTSTVAPAGSSSTGPNIGDLVKAGKLTTYKVTYNGRSDPGRRR